MKKYIIFSCNLDGLGGGKLYLRNKINFLKERGWTVEIFPWRQMSDDTIIIPELKGYSLYKDFLYELSVPPHYLSKSKRRKVVERLYQAVECGADEYFVESNSKTPAYWGELLAQKLDCPNLCFLIAENFSPVSDFGFYEFKLRRHELAGINTHSLPLLFKPVRELSEDEIFVLKAPCTADILEYSVPALDAAQRADFNFGTIGRLEKRYYIPALKAIFKFCRDHSDKSVNFFIVGGTTVEMAIHNNAEAMKDKPDNLNVIDLGFLSPLPARLFELVDLFISVSGSANVSARNGVYTISMDVDDSLPIGLLGYTTINSQYRGEGENDTDLSGWIERVLIKREFDGKQFSMPPKKSIDSLMEDHFAFISGFADNKEYFDFDKSAVTGGGALKTACRIFGCRNFVKFSMNNASLRKRIINVKNKK